MFVCMYICSYRWWCRRRVRAHVWGRRQWRRRSQTSTHFLSPINLHLYFYHILIIKSYFLSATVEYLIFQVLSIFLIYLSYFLFSTYFTYILIYLFIHLLSLIDTFQYSYSYSSCYTLVFLTFPIVFFCFRRM